MHQQPICFLISQPSFSAHRSGGKLAGYQMSLLLHKAGRAKFDSSLVRIEVISSQPRYPSAEDFNACRERLNVIPYDCIFPLDEVSLKFLTGKSSIRKWHMSPLDTYDTFRCRKAMPTFHPDAIDKEYHLALYLEMALHKARKFHGELHWPRKQKNFYLNPGIDQSIAILESIRHEPWHSLDIETGNDQINTFGIAWTDRDAIAIKILPEGIPAPAHKKLWDLIAEICEGDSKKIMQNGIYERMYCSRYGIYIQNFAHDTMCAMRLLYPELEKGLDNVGRIYTNEPYWKDDGKIHTAEGARKDWANVKDWEAHLDYNAKDTSGTFEAAMNQRVDLEARGLLHLYDHYIARLFDPTYEMSVRGLPINTMTQAALVAEYEKKVTEAVAQMTTKINHNSSKQKLKLFAEKGVELPKKRNKKTGKYVESADELSLKKARLKHPNDIDLKALLEVSKLEKALSSYLRVGLHSDNHVRYALDPFSTETGRMACKLDVWGMGFNAQTLTSYVKSMIEFPQTEDRVFVNIDLSQAETRFVAMDSCEETLLGMIERKEDIHKFVAAEIYKKPMAEITKSERQLGKKSGHGANYSMGVQTFMDSCLKELDLVLDKKMASNVLEAYHRVFPKIRKWHERIRNELCGKRMLTNPLGLERYFWGRLDDNTFREAYAYRPQSTIPMITNYLIMALVDERRAGRLEFDLRLQVHDSAVLSCKTSEVERIADFALNTKLWHPEVILPAGKLVIPTEVEWGCNLGKVQPYERQ